MTRQQLNVAPFFGKTFSEQLNSSLIIHVHVFLKIIVEIVFSVLSIRFIVRTVKPEAYVHKSVILNDLPCGLCNVRRVPCETDNFVQNLH